MKTTTLLLAAAVSALATAASAAPLAYPGTAWGTVTYPSSVIGHSPESNDLVYQGQITQGADLAVVNGWTVDTFGRLNYTIDTKGVDWNNKVQPSVGVKITRPVKIGGATGVLDLGVEAVYERRFGTEFKTPDRDGVGVRVSAGYWFGWGH